MTNNYDLMTDVEESLKQERLKKFFDDYGPYLIAGAVLLILFTGFSAGWQAWRTKVNAQQTASLMTYMETGDAKILSDMAPNLRGSQRAIARLTAAGLLAIEGKMDEALVQYETSANDSGLPHHFRDLATLMSVRIETTSDLDAAKSVTMIDTLKPLITGSNPWHWHARVESALIAAHGLNDYDAARKYLAPVLEGESVVPATLLERARALDHVFKLRQGELATADKVGG